MSSFKKTYTRTYQKATAFVNTDTQYWKNYEFPVTVKEYSAIDYIDVSPVEPYYIAVTTGTKIDIYHQQTCEVWRSMTRFHNGAFGARFRKDGKLLVSGSEEGEVKLFNYKQKQLLRIFRGHSGSVHRADFVCKKNQIVSFSDDKSAALWDIADEEEIARFRDHKDFIRSGCCSPASEHLFFSGSMDHTVKVWDSRAEQCVATFDQSAPVHDMLCYPTGSILATCGATEIKIWDLVAGKLLTSLSQHHKNITGLQLASNGTRLLSVSLDRHLKVYDTTTYSTLTSKDYPAPILALGVAPGDSTLVTGMLSGGSGLISFEQRKDPSQGEDPMVKKKRDPKNAPMPKLTLMPGDEVVIHIEKEKLSTYDKLLSRFQYTKVLDNVLQNGVTNNRPHVTVAVMRELIRRDGLRQALTGRDEKTLCPLLRFLIRQIRNPAFHWILIEVTNTLLDLYEDTLCENSKLLGQLTRLNEEIGVDLAISRSGIGLMGAIEMFMTVSSVRDIQSFEKTFTAPVVQDSITSQNLGQEVKEDLNKVIDIS